MKKNREIVLSKPRAQALNAALLSRKSGIHGKSKKAIRRLAKVSFSRELGGVAWPIQ
jgi:hypothetical protein